jgi:hypothetical protein
MLTCCGASVVNCAGRLGNEGKMVAFHSAIWKEVDMASFRVPVGVAATTAVTPTTRVSGRVAGFDPSVTVTLSG